MRDGQCGLVGSEMDNLSLVLSRAGVVRFPGPLAFGLSSQAGTLSGRETFRQGINQVLFCFHRDIVILLSGEVSSTSWSWSPQSGSPTTCLWTLSQAGTLLRREMARQRDIQVFFVSIELIFSIFFFFQVNVRCK